MWLSSLAVFLSLLHLIFCQTYDDLGKDDCFKKIYVCGDLRSRVSAEDGKLVSNTREFAGRCKANKEFMACIDDAAVYCEGKLNDFSEMVLRNRQALKTICSDPVWGQRYVNSVPCINDNVRKISRQCRDEDLSKPDGRPWWCLIPEPCDAIERVFSCTVHKIEEKCGQYSGEIYRKMQLLKQQNQDVVCEFRRRNPYYCKYNRTQTASRPRREATIADHSDPKLDISSTLESIQSAVSEAVTNVARALTIDIIDSVVRNVESSAVRWNDEKCYNESLGKFFKEMNLLKSNVVIDEDCENLVSVEELNSKNKHGSSSGHKANFYSHIQFENILNSACPTDQITEKCFIMAKNMWNVAKLNEMPEASSDTAKLVKYMKASLTKIQESEDNAIVVDQTGRDDFKIYLNTFGDLDIKKLNCSLMANSILKCDLNLDSGSEMSEGEFDQTNEDTEPEFYESFEQVFVLTPTEIESEDSETIWTDETDSSKIDPIDELKESDKFEDRTGEAFTHEALSAFENDFSTLSEALKTDSNPSVSLMETTGFPFLNTDKSFILLGDPYYPTESSNVFLTMESDDSTTPIYVVSEENVLNAHEPMDSSPEECSIEEADIAVEKSNPEASIDTEAGTEKESDNEWNIKLDYQSRKMEELLQKEFEVLSEILKYSDTVKGTSEMNETVSDESLQNTENIIDPVADGIEFGDEKRFKATLLNGLADVHSDESENLDELLRNLKFEVIEESSEDVEATTEEPTSVTDRGEISISGFVKSSVETEKTEL